MIEKIKAFCGTPVGKMILVAIFGVVAFLFFTKTGKKLKKKMFGKGQAKKRRTKRKTKRVARRAYVKQYGRKAYYRKNYRSWKGRRAQKRSTRGMRY